MFSYKARTHVKVPQYNGKVDNTLIYFQCNSTFVQEHMFYDVYCNFEKASPSSQLLKRREESTMKCFTVMEDNYPAPHPSVRF